MFRWGCALVAVFIGSVGSLSYLGAFELTPISMTLETLGENSSGVVNLTNPHETPKAIQLSITTREPDEFGIENNEDAEDNFLVYPPQILLMPKNTQTVRISWIGEPQMKVEKAFRFIAEELNVELDEEIASGKKKASNIRLLMKYEGALYIAPTEKAASQLSIKKVGEHGKDPQKLSFYFENTGNVHQVLYDLSLTLTQDNQEFHYPTEVLKGVSGINVLAQSKRFFSLEKPEGFVNGKDYEISFNIVQPAEID